MANLIKVTSWTKLDYENSVLPAPVAVSINVKNILTMSTPLVPFKTTGITDIVYEYPVNQMKYQLTLKVTEAEAAILTAANA